MVSLKSRAKPCQIRGFLNPNIAIISHLFMDSENSLFYGVTKLLFMESENTNITTRLDLTLVMLWVYTRVQIDTKILVIMDYSSIVLSAIVIAAGAGYLCLFLGRRNKTIEQPNGAIGYRASSFIFFCLALNQTGQAIDLFVFPVDRGVLGLSLILIYSTIRARENNWKSWRVIGFLTFLSIANYLMKIYEAYF